MQKAECEFVLQEIERIEKALIALKQWAEHDRDYPPN